MMNQIRYKKLFLRDIIFKADDAFRQIMVLLFLNINVEKKKKTKQKKKTCHLLSWSEKNFKSEKRN